MGILCNKLLVIHGRSRSRSISLLPTEEEDDTLTFPADLDLFGDPVASCHQLLLTVKDELQDDEELALWNPSTKVFKTLPRPPRPPPEVEYDWDVGFYGLGLDPKTNDFKVIRFVEFDYEVIGYKDAGFMGYHVVELYSLKTGSWKRIPYPHAANASPGHDKPVYINGFNYWTAYTGNEELVIISFDFANESFPSALIPGPNKAYKFDEEDRHRFLLAEFEGSLALVVYDKHDKLLELWVWKNESWSRRGVWEVGVDVFYPLAFLKNRLFYFEDFEHELVIFDCAKQKLKKNLGVYSVPPLYLVTLPLVSLTMTT